ncbi:Kelch-like protein 38 [Tetrabaena socialis]|uniref:Kelch-like protein 38 n=1 Tax=Tetrabaena socialis TaxID=47790 RepID=A0A2J7ZPX7_9CHLO|nr:Kelch-like protein 38 [Tetrabaena socialis]|eukprot:PNH02323.1 Kelch-like protein 38 [Tetrabaena socialis]
MDIFSCIVSIADRHGTAREVVSRPLPGSGEGATQTLLVWDRELRPLTCADSRGRLEVGPPLRIYADPASRDGHPTADRPLYDSEGFSRAAWDAHSSALYLTQRHAVVRVGRDDSAAVVAGSLGEGGHADGHGRGARFRVPFHLTLDGAGALYVEDFDCIRKLQLPPVPRQQGNRGPALGSQLAGAAGVAGGAAQEAEGEVVVSTLLTVEARSVMGLAFHSGSGSLLYATATAVYRVPLGAASAAPVLLAGSHRREGPPHAADGRGLDARFKGIMGLVVDGEGAVYLLDVNSAGGADGGTTAVRRLAAEGTVTTVAAGIAGLWHAPSILPNGYLALCSFSSAGPALLVLDLGLKPQCCRPAVCAPTGPPRRTLPADLRALLDRQPDGTADVTIVVGGRAFPVHRGLLCARSDYFQQRLEGGFADGSEQQLSLPEADPDAFEVVLRFVYTDDADDIPEAQALAVAELADRLLLPELARQAAAVVEASVTPGTVMGLLLWAEARGPAFSELLSRLKAWYVENQEAVAAAAPNTLKRLAEGSPDLTAELMVAVATGEGATQTLLVCGDELRALTGADLRGRLDVGPPLRLFANPPLREGHQEGRRPHDTREHMWAATWDAHSSALYLTQGPAVVRVGSDDTAVVVAGDLDEEGDADGRGCAARFNHTDFLTSDAAGALYVGDGDRIRKLQLQPVPGQQGNRGEALRLQLAGGAGAEAGAAHGAEGEVVVSTLLTVEAENVSGLVFHRGSSSLLYAIHAAIYQFPLGAASAVPVLLAGYDEGEEAPHVADGCGLDARFNNITGLVVDGEGAVYIADLHDIDVFTTAVRRLAPDGTVTTVATGIAGAWHSPSILPNGYLTLCNLSPGGPALLVLDLGLTPQCCHPAVCAPTGPPRRTLPADLRALLDRQPHGTADVTIVVGGRAFPVHRAVLCARSDYFQQRLGGGFADGSEQQLSLPEADPDVFEVVLRFVYTDDADDIPAAQAQAVAELADRLLLPELAQQAAAVVEASVGPGTVVGLLLWAEARSPAFSELLSRLKAWYVENQEAVAVAAPNTLKRLAEGSPGLTAELMLAVATVAKRPRTMAAMNVASCVISVTGGRGYVRAAVSRPLPGSGEGATQTLLVCGHELRPLTCADSHGRLEVGPPLALYSDPASRDGQPAAERRPYDTRVHMGGATWDAHSSALYLTQGGAIVRVNSDDAAAVVAGALDADGRGRAARFDFPSFPTSDGAGALYVGDCQPTRIRKLQLPPVPGQQGSREAALGSQLAGGAGAAGGGAQEAEGEVVVSTLLNIEAERVSGLAFHRGSGSLLYATTRAVYRLPLGAASAAPVLLAGAEEDGGTTDGRGLDARFNQIRGLVVDGEGAVYVADVRQGPVGDGRPLVTTAVRRLAADGTVATVAADIDGHWHFPSSLPNGYLTLCNLNPGGPALLVLDLGLKPQCCRPTACAPTGPPRRTLTADLRALLDRQPDGTADVTIVVGGRAFPAHRALLCARSDYFQQRLGGGFADGSEQQLSLPEADPDAFEVVVRFVYTDDADIPATQAQAVAELADRLLLPELARQAAAVVEESVAPGTAVGLLLWAEARGPAFSELLSRLKAWYVENQRAVAAAAPNTLKRLVEESPDLTAELMLAVATVAKWPRAG